MKSTLHEPDHYKVFSCMSFSSSSYTRTPALWIYGRKRYSVPLAQRKSGIFAAWGWSVLQNVCDVFVSWIARLIKTTCEYLWVCHSNPGTVRGAMKCVSTFTWLEIDISLPVSSLGKQTRTDAIQICLQLGNIHNLLELKYDFVFKVTNNERSARS